MFPSSSCNREKVYESVTQALRVTFDDFKELPGQAAHNLPGSVFDTIASVQSVVNAAYADFNEHWNSSYPDPLLRLPVEIAAECWRPLPESGRIAVSHVSRAWRRTALAERSLWTDISLPVEDLNQAAKLSAWLLRSHPLPFQLTGSYIFDADGDIEAAVVQNLDRMQSIRMSYIPRDFLSRIFSHPASILQSFTVTTEWCYLPARWGIHAAPQLQAMDIGVFYVPSLFDPLLSMRKFCGLLPFPDDNEDNYAGLHGLFSIFPNLVSLQLGNITDESLSRIPSFPPSLVDVTLSTADGVAIDFSPFLQSRVHSTMQKLSLRTVDAMAASIDAFAAHIRGPWSMHIAWEGNVTLKDTMNDMTFFLKRKYWHWWGVDPFVHQLDRLETLALPLDVLVDFGYEVYVAPWDRQLPGLRTLTIAARRPVDLAEANQRVTAALGSPQGFVPVHAARLEEVILEMMDATPNLAYITTRFAAVLARLVTYDRAKPKMVAILTDDRQ